MQVLKVSRRTLARYKADGKITPVTVNNKDLYSPEDLAHFSAAVEATQDKLSRQTSYNSHRISQLELRISALEALLDITPRVKLSLSDVDLDELRSALVKLCQQGNPLWTIELVSDLLGDISRMGDDVLDALGESLVATCVSTAMVHAKRLKHSRSQLLLGRGELLRKTLSARRAKYVGPRVRYLTDHEGVQ
jgi:hypothetical protein